MTDDQGIILFLAIGVVVLAAIVGFGIRSSRKKARAQKPTFTTRLRWLGEQPYFESSELAMDDRRQEEIFRTLYAIGSEATVPAAAPETPSTILHVSRIGRSLRSGWPNAKIGFTAYFAEFENVELPVEFAVAGSDGVTLVELSVGGVTGRGADGQSLWASTWADLTFSNGPTLILANGASRPLTIEYANAEPELEELVIKYGTLKQMHF